MISIGEILDGKYRVVRRLGSGGFGEVFLAEDQSIPDRFVAIKVLNERSGAAGHSDLIWEMKILAGLNHPGVVAFYHHFTVGERLFFVMEFCWKGSLDDRLIGGGHCSQTDVLRWGLALCETLAFVHQNEIVHHDIKPANILFTKDDSIKLGDFGVANRNVGTLMYMPPEMLLGEHVSKTDPRVDVYALGLTLLESLTGRHPFEELDSSEACRARVALPPLQAR